MRVRIGTGRPRFKSPLSYETYGMTLDQSFSLIVTYRVAVRISEARGAMCVSLLSLEEGWETNVVVVVVVVSCTEFTFIILLFNWLYVQYFSCYDCNLHCCSLSPLHLAFSLGKMFVVFLLLFFLWGLFDF